HWEWFKSRCSTLKGDYRYTSNTVFDTFPWPQSPSIFEVRRVALAAKQLRQLRRDLMQDNGWCLRDLYRTMELPGENPLKAAHRYLDHAVRRAYEMPADADVLEFLLDLNQQLAEREARGKNIAGPGLPPSVTNPTEFVSDDCVKMPD
ncbi:MAG: class I SAM-dependent DNA methyltransferase, partial [Planctomycetes bacterium]|nr:class I SAM-dependent DNA methyltransferase [Planctomycetota bacterium]